ncbi:hypothetical protein C0995_008109 [Termitomyces sp. Mi166|nr:hypothetical protein C0995_008109 [Termitomyces sp. Mi166\
MYESYLLPLVYVALVVPTGLLIKWWFTPSSRLPYPPGPTPRLISGNYGELPTVLPWLKYTSWAKQYGHYLFIFELCLINLARIGSLVHLRAFRDHIVVVSTVEDANAMFEKRSRIYSDRPTLTMINLMGFNFMAAFVGYGEKWRRHRRLYQQTLNKTAVQRTQEPTQTLKVHEYLSQLIVTPDDFMSSVTASVIMATVYDNNMSQSEIERFTDISEAAMVKLSDAFFPGTFVVDALPFLKYLPAWFPGAGFKKYAADSRALTDEMQNGPFKYVKEQLGAGLEISGLVSTLLEHKSDADESFQKEVDIKEIAATIFGAGADTSVSALSTFIYAMVVNVGAQKKGQAEIDALIGPNRLPDFGDRPNLPYIEAIYREVMRWHPVTPLGVSHAALEDDVYNGYFIPKGFSNLPIHHDVLIQF